MRPVLLAVAMAVLAFTATAARALTAAPYGSTTTFVTVDAVQVDYSYLTVSGIRQGDGAASDWRFTFYIPSSPTEPGRAVAQIQSCERMALLAMAKPGQYLLEVVMPASSYGEPSCKLARVIP